MLKVEGAGELVSISEKTVETVVKGYQLNPQSLELYLKLQGKSFLISYQTLELAWVTKIASEAQRPQTCSAHIQKDNKKCS